MYFSIYIFSSLFYSYDARNGGPENGQRWSDNERGFGSRARFHWRDGPAYLHIEKIHALEAGVYRCRVDFKTAPTRNSLLNLTVVSEYSVIDLLITHFSIELRHVQFDSKGFTDVTFGTYPLGII